MGDIKDTLHKGSSKLAMLILLFFFFLLHIRGFPVTNCKKIIHNARVTPHLLIFLKIFAFHGLIANT